MSYDNPAGGRITIDDPTDPTVSVIEPQITTTKTVTPASAVEAGDSLTYTVRFTK